MLTFVLACVLPSLLISALATAAMRWLAPRWGLIDQPAARKVHESPTPLGGGVGVWLGVVLPLAGAWLVGWLISTGNAPRWLVPAVIEPHLSGVASRAGQLWSILAAGTILAAMGLLDDLRNLPWQPRLGIQVAVAVALVLFGGVRATVFAPQPWIGGLLTVVWILVLVNSFNFLDNMDGLSSGIALIAATLFAILMLTGTSEPRWLVGGALLVLAGSISGFLFFHNWPPARIFMGDSGSYLIGLMMATLTVLGTFYDEHSSSQHVILAPLFILAIPLYDFTSVLLIRLWQRRSPFQPDRSHFSHRLVDLGLSRKKAVQTVYLTTLTTGLGALLLYQVPGWQGAGVISLLILCVLAIVAVLERAARKKQHG